MRKLASVFWLFLVFSFVFSVSAQEILKFEDFKLKSKLMSREMPYRVIFPLTYRQKDEKNRFPVIYLLHGLAGSYKNWTELTKITEYAANYNFIIVMPDGNDGWYSDSVSVPNDKHESYLVNELIPEVDAKFRTFAKRESRVITGLSMGGYGALKFGIKYSDKFVLAGSFSGALDSPLRGQDNSFLRPSIMSVYGEEGNPARKMNDIFSMINQLSAEKIKEMPFFYLDCGTDDIFYQTNLEFAALLYQKKIPHEFRQLPGQHNWKFWDTQVQEFLRISHKFVK